ncbi:MAG: metallopeptidase family protein [Ornithinimicrobium sp.]
MSDDELLSSAEFEEAIADALDSIPSPLLGMLSNVVFLVSEEPSPPNEPDLLGIYDGVPLTDRHDGWTSELPDHITVFRGPLTRMCSDRAELVEEIAVTIVHEVAHHFGIEEDRLHELGWG